MKISLLIRVARFLAVAIVGTLALSSRPVSAQTPAIEQVTSVSQLSDVQPTDWAYQALQSLVERYGCIVGYPDSTYRGNRSLTRYEFAAGLNACLDRINELIAASTADLATKEDLATLQRLQEEFAAELATLRGRVDSLEARTAQLEATQFSTTTKLSGEAIFALTDAWSDEAEDNQDDNQTVLQDRVRINFNTSFTGSDLLRTRLVAGNGTNLALPGGTAEGVQAYQAFGDTGNDVILDSLFYRFPVGEKATVTIAGNDGRFQDFTPTLNPYFEDDDGGNGSLSAFAQRNPIYRIGGGQGIGVSVKPSETLELTAGYLAAEGSDPSEHSGLFNGSYAALGQITWSPSDNTGVALTYSHGYFGQGEFAFDNGSLSGNGLTGTSPANRISSFGPSDTDSFGLQMAWQISPKFQLNSWVGYTNLQLLGTDVSGDIWNGAIALAFPDLGKEGNLGGIVIGVQPYVSSVDDFNESIEEDTPFHIEAFYKFQVNDRISITPGAIWLTTPDQDNNNGDAVVGTVRATFNF